MTSQKLLAHHDAAGTSELSDVAARSPGMNRCYGHAITVNRILIGGLELRCGIIAAYTHSFEQNESDAVCCII